MHSLALFRDTLYDQPGAVCVLSYTVQLKFDKAWDRTKYDWSLDRLAADCSRFLTHRTTFYCMSKCSAAPVSAWIIDINAKHVEWSNQ